MDRFFSPPVKYNKYIRKYKKNYASRYPLDYLLLNNYNYKVIAIDLCKTIGLICLSQDNTTNRFYWKSYPVLRYCTDLCYWKNKKKFQCQKNCIYRTQHLHMCLRKAETYSRLILRSKTESFTTIANH